MTFAGSAASPPGRTSSSCSRSRPRSRGTRGADSRPSVEELEWDQLPDPSALRPEDWLEQRARLEALSQAIGELTDRQREVFVAVALNDVPIDVLAVKLGTNRNAVYKNLFDARRRLRARMAAAGHPVSDGASARSQLAAMRDLVLLRRVVAMTLRCVIVDDSPAVLRAASELLERQGIAVVGVAANCEEAVRLMERVEPDVVLVDIDLGPESGFDLARRLAGDARQAGIAAAS